MTINAILAGLKPDKTITREALYKHLRAMKIKPIGQVRQIPAQYPDSVLTKLRKRFGLPTTNGNGHASGKSRR